MAAQGIWSGTISFSLVAIPVRLVKAVDSGRISFHLLHKNDNARLSRKLFCPADNAIVPPDGVVRGYEIVPDKYLLLSDEELESVSPERSRTIEILEFIDLKEIDPIYFDHPYYLVPLKGGEKAYQLLVEVMHHTGRAGLARFVLSEREYLVAVTSRDNALAVTTLHYRDEILPDEDRTPKKDATGPGDVDRMVVAIRQMIGDFNPGKYAHTRTSKIREILEAKKKSNALVESPAPPEEAGEGPADLVAALEESMRKMKGAA